MKIKTSELSGIALDWAVDVALGHQPIVVPFRNSKGCTVYQADWARREGIQSHYSTAWAQGGPIIERVGIGVRKVKAIKTWHWEAALVFPSKEPHYGPTPLVAAMRCLVASKLGDEIEVSNDLLES